MTFIKAVFAKNTFLSKLLIILLTILFGLSLSTAIAIVFTHTAGYGTETLKIVQCVQSVCTFILPAFICAYLFSEKPTLFLGLRKSSKNAYPLTILGILCAIPLVNLLADINEKIILPDFLSTLENWMLTAENQAKELTDQFLNVDSISGLLVNLFVMAIVPAFSEEFIFRGLLQNVFLSKFKIHGAVWITAFIFSFAHFQFYGFLPRMVLGALFGYFVCWSGSLWPAILAHFVNNALSVCYAYYASNAELPDVESWGTGENGWMGIASLCATATIVFLFYKKAKTTNDGAPSQ